jgi:hypothetical protein
VKVLQKGQKVKVPATYLPEGEGASHLRPPLEAGPAICPSQRCRRLTVRRAISKAAALLLDGRRWFPRNSAAERDSLGNLATPRDERARISTACVAARCDEPIGSVGVKSRLNPDRQTPIAETPEGSSRQETQRRTPPVVRARQLAEKLRGTSDTLVPDDPAPAR